MASFIPGLRKWWERLQGIDRRRFQLEVDTHRLSLLLTSYNTSGGKKSAEEVLEFVQKASFDEQREQVQKNVHDQVCQIAGVMDDILRVNPQEKRVEKSKMVEENRSRPSGLSFALGRPTPKPKQQEMLAAVETRTLKRVEVSDALKEHLGYTLALRSSQIDHEEAGLGVFLVGRACPGAVVSMYPGVIYTPSQYRYLPGYPKMDKQNSYLISRYDGLIIDGKPWGDGAETREFWNGSSSSESDTKLPSGEGFQIQGNERKRTNLWQLVGGNEETCGARKGAVLERRNPLALAHYANHPVNGLQPNVMICAYDFPVVDVNVRPYIPNVLFDDVEEAMHRRGLLWVRSGRSEKENFEELPVIRTIVLVATREICDEELFLNYRLSNSKHWPAWYQPVNREEDSRRWD